MSTINRVIYFILLITLGVFIYLLINLGLVPDKYIWVLLAVCISIISIIGTINFTFKNNILHTIMLLFTLLLIGGFTYINYNLFKTNSFINVIDNELKEEVSYYLLTKKDNSYKNVLELENTTVGVYSFNSNNFKDAYENLKEKFTFNEKEYNDVSFLIKDLKNSKISAIFISANNYEILKEIFTEFDWEKVGLEEYPPMVCRTTHFYPERNLKVHIYHMHCQ